MKQLFFERKIQNISTTVIVLKQRKMSTTRSHYSDCEKYTNGNMESVYRVRHYSISSSTMCCWNGASLNQVLQSATLAEWGHCEHF